jgi:predicted GIY-YIG superfamily endonuclease
VASQAIVSDQQTVAWLARHKVGLLSVLAGIVAGEVWIVHVTGLYLPFSGMVLFGLLAYGVRYLAGLAWWWNRRRILLAEHSLPAPGPIDMWRDRRLERKRIAYVHKQWSAFCTANSITGVGKIIPKLHNVRGTVSGDLTALISPGPITVKGGVEKIASLATSIAETCGCVEVLVRPTGVGHANLTFLWTQAMERVLPVAQLPRSRKGQIAFGVRRDGNAAGIAAGLSVLVAGLTGAGKSGITWSLLADLNRQGIAVDLYASDPKGGIELGVLANLVGDRTSNLNVVDYCSGADDTKRLIEACEQQMKKRQQAQTNRAWTVDDAAEQPLIILLIDECVEVLALMKTAGPTNNRGLYLTKLKTIISQGRASGVMVVALTQMAQKEVIGDVRDMFAQRLCLATRNAINTDMVLGDGAEAAGALCSKIVNRPGVGYSFDEARRGYELFRAAWCDDDDIKRIAAGQIPEGMDTGLSKGEVNRSTAVYRFHNGIGELLYVGKTVDLKARFEQHAASKPWWHEVDMSRTLVTWHPSEEAALRVEEHEIKTRLPRYNKQHNGGNPLARPYVKPEPAEPAPSLLRLVLPERRTPQPWEFRPVRVSRKRNRKSLPVAPTTPRVTQTNPYMPASARKAS